MNGQSGTVATAGRALVAQRGANALEPWAPIRARTGTACCCRRPNSRGRGPNCGSLRESLS
eukprot:5873187-Lingulodinium_polyedra.AAC.1